MPSVPLKTRRGSCPRESGMALSMASLPRTETTDRCCRSPIPGGTGPENWFWCNLSHRSLGSFSNESGSVPESWLPDRSNSRSSGMSPKSGMLPVNLLLESRRLSMTVLDRSDFGMVPSIWLLSRFNVARQGAGRKSSGRVPVISLWDKSNLWVAIQRPKSGSGPVMRL
ncbi:hypothetical protein DIPPA_06472 [Diplonema papillatum]|nr:hypothetical protein DIPPA_06472 [Diplonema papillatum]